MNALVEVLDPIAPGDMGVERLRAAARDAIATALEKGPGHAVSAEMRVA